MSLLLLSVIMTSQERCSKCMALLCLSSFKNLCKHEAPVLAHVQTCWQQVHSSDQGEGRQSVPGLSSRARRAHISAEPEGTSVLGRKFSRLCTLFADSRVALLSHALCRDKS